MRLVFIPHTDTLNTKHDRHTRRQEGRERGGQRERREREREGERERDERERERRERERDGRELELENFILQGL